MSCRCLFVGLYHTPPWLLRRFRSSFVCCRAGNQGAAIRTTPTKKSPKTNDGRLCYGEVGGFVRGEREGKTKKISPAFMGFWILSSVEDPIKKCFYSQSFGNIRNVVLNKGHACLDQVYWTVHHAKTYNTLIYVFKRVVWGGDTWKNVTFHLCENAGTLAHPSSNKNTSKMRDFGMIEIAQIVYNTNTSMKLFRMDPSKIKWPNLLGNEKTSRTFTGWTKKGSEGEKSWLSTVIDLVLVL